jgi:SAM-dependent methyltransferase
LVTRKLNLPLSGNKILDIGCYDGFLLSHIDAAEKFGIDVDILKKYPDIQYIGEDFLQYNFKDEKFDRIFAFDVLEHVKEDKIFLEKIIQLLSTEGMAILSTPCENIKIFPPFLQSWVDKRWGHIYRRGYVPQRIKEFVEDIGLGNSITINAIYWNCPIFRFLYLPLSMLWRISPMLTKKVLNFIVGIESRSKEGENGFLYSIITKGNEYTEIIANIDGEMKEIEQ